MKKIYKLMLAVALLFSATWQVAAQAAVVPPTDGSYFYIKFTRGTNLVLKSQGAGINLVQATLVAGQDAQLWKAVSNGVGGYFFVSKALGGDNGTTELAIAFDAVANRFIAAPYDQATTPALTTTTSGITTNAAYLPAAVILFSPTQAMNPAGGSGPGQQLATYNVINDDGNALQFVNNKALLSSEIARFTLISTTSGYRPADVQAALLAAIAAANTVYNDANSTDANCLTAISNLGVALVAYDAYLAPPTDGSYFYIHLQQGTNNTKVVENEGTATTPAGANLLKTAELVFNKDAQLWRADPDGAGGYYFVSKQKDLNDANVEIQIAWDAVASRFIAAPYTGNSSPLYTITRGISTNTNVVGSSDIVLSPTATQGMNPFGGANNVGSQFGIWNITDDADAVKFITEDSTRVLLPYYLSQVNDIIGGANLNPGNRSQEAINLLKGVLVSTQAAYDNPATTTDQIVAAAVALQTALAVYNATPLSILPQVSTADNVKWYFFQGTRPANSYMTSMGAGALVLSKPVIPDDTQLWKIVNNTNPAGSLNGYALVNKVTGEYLNTDNINNTALNTVPDMPVMNVVFNISTIMTKGVARFWIENAGVTSASTDGFTFRLHAGNSQILNWYGSRTDNSSWLLMDYSLSLKGFLKDAITAANVVVNDTHVGTALGQYPADAQATLATAVATAQAVYDNASATDADCKAAVVTLDNAVIICRGRHGDAVISTAQNPRWFAIRNLFRTDAAGVIKNQVITTNGVLENGLLFCETQANVNEQLWRFESNATGGVKIISAAQPTLAIKDSMLRGQQQKLVAVANASGYIIDSLGTGLKLTSTFGNPLHDDGTAHLLTYDDVAGTATNWAIEEKTSGLFIPQTLTFDPIPTKVLGVDAMFDLAATSNATGSTTTYTSSDLSVAYIDGITVNIVGQGTSVITATNSGNDTYARTSVQQTLTVSLVQGLQDITDGISVLVKNRIITVTGTNAPVRVFTVTGTEVDARRALAQGIYIVKVANKKVKVSVR